MPDDVLSIEDIATANFVGAEEGIWDMAQPPPWRLTWTAPAAVSLALGVAETCSDIAIPFDLL